MHNWWCLQSGHSLSLSCQRHELQQRHREAANATQMEQVKAQLEALLAKAAAECAAALHTTRPPTRPPLEYHPLEYHPLPASQRAREYARGR